MYVYNNLNVTDARLVIGLVQGPETSKYTKKSYL